MFLLHLLKSLSIVELVLTWVALAALLRTSTQRHYMAMKVYLLCSGTAGILLNTLINFRVMSPASRYTVYFYTFWTNYVLCALAIFFVIQQVFGQALAPLSGLRRMGLVFFRWVAITSVILVIASSALPAGLHFQAFSEAMCQMMRCVSIMEICLLAFLALSVHSLGYSFRSRIFGVGLGLGIAACTDLLRASILQHGGAMVSVANVMGEVGSLLSMLLWIAYFVKAEPARKPVTLPVTSPLLRWNEIANALGHTGGQVVLNAPSAFFLQDVEKVVDRVLTKNSLNEPRAS